MAVNLNNRRKKGGMRVKELSRMEDIVRVAPPVLVVVVGINVNV